MQPGTTPPPSSDFDRGDPVTEYAEAVVSGVILAGPHVRDACARHLRDLQFGPERGLHWDVDAAWRFIDFCAEICTLNGSEFEGQPFVLLDWQMFGLGSIFGWKREDGYRRFRYVYFETAKGSGKSPMAAAVGHYMAAADGEARAEVYAFASKLDQAQILFRDAVAMYQASPPLAGAYTALGRSPIKRLTHLKSQSWFEPVSVNSGLSGPRPYCAIGDEVHEHKDGVPIDMMEAGFKFRKQPLLFLITNSGSDRKSVCWQWRQRGVLACGPDDDDDAMFAFICSLDEGDDPLDPKTGPACWFKANPSLGTTIQPDYLAARVAMARKIPANRNKVLRLNFCVWTDAESVWLDRETWSSCEDDELGIEDFADRETFVGLDLSKTTDLTAAAYVAPDGFDEEGRPKFVALVRQFTPERGLHDRADRDSVPYDAWVDAGYLRTTPGPTVRYEHVAADLIGVGSDHGAVLKGVAYDRYAIKRFEEAMDDLGSDLELVEHPQGFRRSNGGAAKKPGTAKPDPDAKYGGLYMPDSIGMLETLILEGRIRIAVCPVLRMNAASATFDEDAQGNRKFAKQKAANRIDGVVALAMAVGFATDRSASKPSVYEERGVLVF